MKFIKYSFIALVAFSFTACLKPKSDFAGLRDDEGQIVTSVKERQYQKHAIGNLNLTYRIAANFSFSARPNELVKFFTLNISQPREKRMSGPMTVTVEMVPIPTTGVPAPGTTVALPPAAVNIVPVVVPASTASEIDFPVRFTVNKTLLDPTLRYGARFIVKTVSQGVVTAIDNFVDVYINFGAAYNNSNWTGRYNGTTTITDSAKRYQTTNDTRQFRVYEGDPFGTYIPNYIVPATKYFLSFVGIPWFSVTAFDATTGASTPLADAVYILDATGKVIDVEDYNTGLSLNPVFDNSAPNKFVYNANDDRVLHVKYTVRLTIDGLNRPFKVEDRFVYDNQIQAF